MCLSTRQEKARQTTRPRSDIRSSIHHALHQVLADFTFNGVTFPLVHDVSGAETAATPDNCSYEHDFNYKNSKFLRWQDHIGQSPVIVHSSGLELAKLCKEFLQERNI